MYNSFSRCLFLKNIKFGKIFFIWIILFFTTNIHAAKNSNIVMDEINACINTKDNQIICINELRDLDYDYPEITKKLEAKLKKTSLNQNSLELAIIYFIRDEFDLSINIANQILLKNPKDKVALILKFLILKGDQFLDAIDALIEYYPDNLYYFYKAATLSNLGRYIEAIENYDNYISKTKGNSEAYSGRASTYSKMKEFDKASDDYESAIKLDPNFEDALARSCLNSAIDQGKIDEIKYCNKALEINENNLVALFVLIKNNMHNEKFHEAIKFCDKFLEQDEDKLILELRGLSYFAIGDYKKAESDLLEVSNDPEIDIEVKNENQEYLSNIYILNEEFEKAEEIFKNLIKNSTNLAYNYNQLGIVYALWHKYDQAIEAFTQSIEQDPINCTSPRFNRATSYILQKNFDKAQIDCAYFNSIKLDMYKEDSFKLFFARLYNIAIAGSRDHKDYIDFDSIVNLLKKDKSIIEAANKQLDINITSALELKQTDVISSTFNGILGKAEINNKDDLLKLVRKSYRMRDNARISLIDGVIFSEASDEYIANIFLIHIPNNLIYNTKSGSQEIEFDKKSPLSSYNSLRNSMTITQNQKDFFDFFASIVGIFIIYVLVNLIKFVFRLTKELLTAFSLFINKKKNDDI
jgi:tetratricopeptide (TPR) repeat protein